MPYKSLHLVTFLGLKLQRLVARGCFWQFTSFQQYFRHSEMSAWIDSCEIAI